jgi:hypothetical protein
LFPANLRSANNPLWLSSLTVEIHVHSAEVAPQKISSTLSTGTPHLLPVFERLFLKGVMIDSDAQNLPIPGASIGTGTNRIPDIKTSIEMESIFVPGQSQISLSKQPALALFADC